MTDPGAARILEGGYRRYDGVRSGARGAVESVALHTAQRALGLRRAARFKVLPVLAAVLAYVPAIVYAGLAVLLPGDLTENGVLPTYAQYYFFITAAIVVFTAFVAPEVLCTDRRTGMIGLYLASPLTRTTYLVAKATAVLGVLAVVTLGPPLFLLLAYVLVGSGPDGPVSVAAFVLRIVAAGTLLSAFFGSLSMAVSSITDRKAAASAAVVILLLLSAVVTNSLVEAAGASPTLLLANLFELPFEAVVRVFGEPSDNPELGRLATPVVVGATVAWTLAASALVWLRYRALEVTR
ncbi:MAG: ABC transporter permease subunit [Microthrixaceae bacterium]|nr:ABC transporter permease subunit [Microthrixaceae bacterium]